MRTLKLTNEEIELIEKALRLMESHLIKVVADNRKTLDNEVIEAILKNSYKFDDLRADIYDGKKDV